MKRLLLTMPFLVSAIDPCDNPYHTITVDGVTYSGSTKTAQGGYLELAETLKKVVFSTTLSQEDRLLRMKNIKELMDHLNKFRGECKENTKTVLIEGKDK